MVTGSMILNVVGTNGVNALGSEVGVTLAKLAEANGAALIVVSNGTEARVRGSTTRGRCRGVAA